MKFKVGDRVRAIGSVDGICLRGKCGTVVEILPDDSEYDLLVEFDEPFPSGHDGPGGRYKKGCCRWGKEDEFEFESAAAKKEKSTKHPKMVITTDGKETLARLYDESGKVTKSAIALCHPDDFFDFGTGARIAFDRLIEATAIPKTEKREPFMGKAVCIANGVKFVPYGDITIGKIYDFSENNGCGKNDNGAKLLSYPRYSIEEINEAMFGNIVFLEIKE